MASRETNSSTLSFLEGESLRGLYASGFRSLERLEPVSDARDGSATHAIQALRSARCRSVLAC